MSPKSIKRLLLIEDNAGDARLLREMLNEHSAYNTSLTHVKGLSEAEKHLAGEGADLILLDLGLPDAQGLEAVRRAHAAAPHVPLVVLTGLDDEALAGQALKEGAQDYLIKGQIEARGLLRAVRYAIERKSMEAALFLEQERAQVTLNCIGDAVACTDVAGKLTFINVVAERMTGWPWQQAAGLPMTDVFRILDAGTRESVPNPMQMTVGRNRSVHLPPNAVLVRRDGFEIAVEDSVAPLHGRDGKATGAVIVLRDVSAARALALQVTHSAQHDFLTGLPNRMLLSDRIGRAITLAPRHKNKVAILFLDLDGFKRINDSLGHPIGDKLLQSVARRLVGCVRASDTVSRQGGDEFVVLLSEVEQAEDVAITARRMLECVAATHSIDDLDLHVTTSIGVSIYPDDGEDVETLIKNADTAMYQAKESGRQSYQFFKPAMNVRAVARQFTEESLRHALERQELAVHYQAQVDLETGAIVGAEALIRWMHPLRGLIPPVEFLPVAEASGLLVPIGQWVLREACAQARAWKGAGLHLGFIAVNVSGLEFRDAEFLAGVAGVLAETDLDPRVLELELAESVLLKHAPSTETILKGLRARGVRLAIDDFGTGHASLRHLRQFQVDTLKIDASLVRRITAAADDTAIVGAAISMGRSLKLRVVAEGVETRSEVAFLRAHQCGDAQGYYFNRPVPAREFAGLLETGLSDRDAVLRHMEAEPGRARPGAAKPAAQAEKPGSRAS